MIDIHTHVIPYVDDGSKSTEDSLNLLKEEIAQGVTDIIATPHFRRGMFEKSLKETEIEYNLFLKEVKKANLNVNLYLGQEIYIHHMSSFNRYLDNNYIRPLNNTDFYLLEFSYFDEIDIPEIAYNIRLMKKNVIIAHIERYNYITLDDAKELKNIGAYIQVNASSVLGKHGLIIKKRVKNLLKNHLVDFISSDIHVSRGNYMDKAYKYIEKKYGKEYADDVFTNNARELLIKG